MIIFFKNVYNLYGVFVNYMYFVVFENFMVEFCDYLVGKNN